jgi:hypothetical protein
VAQASGVNTKPTSNLLLYVICITKKAIDKENLYNLLLSVISSKLLHQQLSALAALEYAGIYTIQRKLVYVITDDVISLFAD